MKEDHHEFTGASPTGRATPCTDRPAHLRPRRYRGGRGRHRTASAATVDTNASYVLVDRNSSEATDVSGASTAGAVIHQWSRHDGANQQ
jgi:hypothetical protein